MILETNYKELVVIVFQFLNKFLAAMHNLKKHRPKNCYHEFNIIFNNLQWYKIYQVWTN